MIKIIYLLVTLALVVLLAEILWHKKVIKGESARKVVHIISGSLIAFTPYFITWSQVRIICWLSLIFFLVIKKTKLIKSWYDISRLSLGEVLAPATILVLAYFEPANVVFAAACLHVALADGFAALIGVRFGKSNTYKILGNSKSIAGTATFFVVSVLIMMGVIIFGGADISISLGALLLVSSSTTLVENLAFSSLDNTLIILTVVGLFKVLNIA